MNAPPGSPASTPAANRRHPRQHSQNRSHGNNPVPAAPDKEHLSPSAAQSAALKGANLAFQKQQRNATPGRAIAGGARSGSGDGALSPRSSNGALMAATSASRSLSPGAPDKATSGKARVSRHSTGGNGQGAGPAGAGGAAEVERGGGHGRDSPERRNVRRRHSQSLSSPAERRSPYLLPPPSGARPGPDPRSTSFIAATLAASRSASPSPNRQTGRGHAQGSGSGSGSGNVHVAAPGHAQRSPSAARPRRRGSLGGLGSMNSSLASLDLPDTRPIGPTTSLISMFEERKEDDTDPVKKSPEQRTRVRPPLRSPTPPRDMSPQGKIEAEEANEQKRIVSGSGEQLAVSKQRPTPDQKPQPRAKPRPASPPQIVRTSTSEIISPKPRRLSHTPNLRPPTPPPARRGPTKSPSAGTIQDWRASAVGLDGLELAKPGSSEMGPSPSPALGVRRSASGSSTDSFVSASSTQSPRARSPTASRPPGPALPRPRADSGPESVPATGQMGRRPTIYYDAPSSCSPRLAPQRPPPRGTSSSASTGTGHGHGGGLGASTSDLPKAVDSLASAMVASSLASARHSPAMSGANTPPPVPTRRRHASSSHHHHNHKKDGRSRRGSESPRRTGMLQTLRQPPSKSDDEDYARRHRHKKHQKKHLGHKKHAHHEGARRRWREELTPRERRRYEAVWASNRGLLLPAGGAASECVADVVVRDLWSRSRLPFDELAELWDLVDQGVGGGEGGKTRGGQHVLTRAEFVVGMWLIDQRLRGRKIPPRVGESVWSSALGVRVSLPKKK